MYIGNINHWTDDGLSTVEALVNLTQCSRFLYMVFSQPTGTTTYTYICAFTYNSWLADTLDCRRDK